MRTVSLGYRTDLRILEMSGSRAEDRGDHIVVSTPSNPGYWWGNFILLERVPAAGESQMWLDRFAEAFAGAGAEAGAGAGAGSGHITLGFDGTDGTVADLAWFARRGFTTEALTVMTAPSVVLPRQSDPEAVYRVLTSDHDWEQSVALRMRCGDQGEGRAIRESYVSGKARSNRRLTDGGVAAWFGAFVQQRLVAQLGLVDVGGGLARFQSVETDPAWRRRGLAGSLVSYAAAWGAERFGTRTLVMAADPDGVAVNLYRSLGFRSSESQLQIEKAPPTRMS